MIKMQTTELKQTELVNVGSPLQQEQEFSLTPEMLTILRKRGLINEKQRVFFALLIDYGKLDLLLSEDDVKDFIERWDIKNPDFLKAIATLESSGLVRNHKTISVQLELLFEDNDDA